MKARNIAYKILKDVCLDKRYSNLALKEDMDELNALDKGLVTNIVYGTLQHYRYIRYQWQHLPETFPREEIAILIDMSVYQLLFMDKVPEYAVINEAVEIAKTVFNGKFEKFVNAILRNVMRSERRIVQGSEEERVAIKYSFPLWIVKMWSKQYGREEAFKICESLNKIPPQTARVNTLKTTKEAILLGNDKFKNGNIAKDALIYTDGNISNTEEYKKGLVTVQDESAQLVAEYLDAKPNDVVLDMCAAPGSKTTHIGAMMKNQGILIALDVHEHRVELIKRNARRMGIICIDAMKADATHLEEEFEKESFDKILLDGPCSGYGVVARKSDIKYHMKSEDMDSCIKIQKELLDSATLYLKKGGTLVYSTCTLNKKENEKQIEAFLNRHKDFVLKEERTIFPYEYDSDGFYIAKLEKLM